MHKFKLSSGHSLYVSGAVGYVDENKKAREIVDLVAKKASDMFATYHDNISKTKKANVNHLVGWHNKTRNHLADYSMHLNASKKTDKDVGVEVLYYNNKHKGHAETLAASLSKATGLKNRGAKYRDNLGFLKNTRKPAFLVEAYFVDSSADVKKMDENHEVEAFVDAFIDTVCAYWGVNNTILQKRKEAAVEAVVGTNAVPARIHSGVYPTEDLAKNGKLLVSKLADMRDDVGYVYYDARVDGWRWASGLFASQTHANTKMNDILGRKYMTSAFTRVEEEGQK